MNTPAQRRSAGGWARVSIGAQSLLATLLAACAALLAIELSDWRYLRVDLSASGQNTLDPAVLEVLERLPEPVAVDVFFRPLLFPYDEVALQAQGRMLELLSVAASAHRDRFEVNVHDSARFEDARRRQRELSVEGENLLVFSCGARRAELQLFGEIAIVDWGNPTERGLGYLASQGIAGIVDVRSWSPRDFRPARLSEFRGEEALAQALLKVSAATAPRVYFSKGQGEPDLRGALDTDLSSLATALERDGFELAEWDPRRTPALPADCEVLAMIGPRQPLLSGAARAVEEYLRSGGRAILAPDLSELERSSEQGVVALLRALGIRTLPGVVCLPVVSETGEKLEGLGYCANLTIEQSGFQPSHPLTELMRRRDRRLVFRLSPAFEGPVQTGKERPALPLVTTPREAWRDLPDGEGQYDYRCDPRRGEARDRQALVSVKEFRPAAGESSAQPAPEARGSAEGRVLAVASAYFFGNRDFLVNRDFALNAFNWLAQRDHRLKVSPRERSQSFLNLERGSAKPVLTYALWLVLPGLCALTAGLVWWRRRS
jgi:hypothetical protein